MRNMTIIKKETAQKEPALTESTPEKGTTDKTAMGRMGTYLSTLWENVVKTWLRILIYSQSPHETFK